MININIRDTINQDEWDGLIGKLPGSHILQTWEWGKIKQEYGWTPLYLTWQDDMGSIVGAALLLERKAGIPLPGLQASVLYIPRGPLLDWHDLELRNQVIQDLVNISKRRNAIFLKIDPDLMIGTGMPGTPETTRDSSIEKLLEEIASEGWTLSKDQVQFTNSIWLDLTLSEEQLLANMKQKTRYNIRLAERKGITVRKGNARDLDLLYRLYSETADRDNFIIRPKEYYLLTWKTLFDNNKAVFLIAEYEQEAVGAIVLFLFAGTAWYFYGMSAQNHREKMPNHLLQWQAIRTARMLGCERYDFWGAPDIFDESDAMWGVFKFKEGFNGKIVRTIGAWDFPARQFLYSLYMETIPRILGAMRKFRQTDIRREQNL